MEKATTTTGCTMYMPKMIVGLFAVLTLLSKVVRQVRNNDKRNHLRVLESKKNIS